MNPLDQVDTQQAVRHGARYFHRHVCACGEAAMHDGPSDTCEWSYMPEYKCPDCRNVRDCAGASDPLLYTSVGQIMATVALWVAWRALAVGILLVIGASLWAVVVNTGWLR